MKTTSILFVIFFSFSVFNSSDLVAQSTDSVTTDSTISADTAINLQNKQTDYVVLAGDSLFQIKAYLGPFSPNERVKVINKRLKTLADNIEDIETDLFIISESNNYSIVFYDSTPILSVSTADADYTNKTREQLAAEYVAILNHSFDGLIKESSTKNWIKKIGFTFLSLLGLFSQTLKSPIF